MKFMILLFFPKLGKLLKFTGMDAEAGEFFIKLVRDSVEQRKESGVRYNDFIDQGLDAFKGESTYDQPRVETMT